MLFCITGSDLGWENCKDDAAITRREKITRPVLENKSLKNAAPFLFLGDQELADLTITIKEAAFVIWALPSRRCYLLLLGKGVGVGGGGGGRHPGHVAMHPFTVFPDKHLLGRYEWIPFTSPRGLGILSSEPHLHPDVQEEVSGLHSPVPRTPQRSGGADRPFAHVLLDVFI